MNERVLELPEVDLVYDVYGPTADRRRPPAADDDRPADGRQRLPDGEVALLRPHRGHLRPRGLGRSTTKDGRVENTPEVQAADVHAIVEALGAGPVDLFASSGGAVTALALVAAYPDDVAVLVAHELPLIPVLPDAEAAKRAQAGYRDAYEANGSGAGMAGFIAMTSWQGEFTDAYFAQPAPDPAAFGMSTEDDGSRDDPLLSDRSWAITGYRPDPSHHGGFLGGEFGYPGQPEAFAQKLREVLEADSA